MTAIPLAATYRLPFSSTRMPPGTPSLREMSTRSLEVSPLVLISVGIEDVEDILWDLDQAVAASQK
jgi:cystathionine beta-lyase/cystathionine gamma-synthase